MKVFHCKCCGSCCRWEGVVRYKPEEGAAIADFLGIPEEEFIQRYTRLAHDRRGLIFAEKADGACIFLTEDNLCSINPVKPHQCAAFPYEWTVPEEFLSKCHGEWTEEE